jgi:hypothetical protein
MRVLVAGWVLTQAPLRCVTEALVATDVARRRHWEAFHRFFSRGTWHPDTLGLIALRLVLGALVEGPVRFALDDTLCAKKGPTVFGLGNHLDAVRSTKRRKVFAFGHCWVVLAVLVRVPFADRVWALPVLFRLYRTQRTCGEGETFRKRTELAHTLLVVAAKALPTRALEVCADEAYGNRTVLAGLPPNITWVGAMRPDAALAAQPTTRAATGRPRIRGATLPKPRELAADARTPWRTLRTTLYGRAQLVRYKTLTALWPRVCGAALVRVVVVRTERGTVPFRVFFCTDSTRPVEAVLQGYAMRWSIEVLFRDLKQLFGFADSPARSPNAVLRTAPFVGLLYTVLTVWFADRVATSPLAVPPVRPWYTHKRGLCFADVLRAAQRVLRGVDVLALPGLRDDVENEGRAIKTPRREPLDTAA